MPIGKYPDFASCVADNQDKASPEGWCAALEHKITGHWPGQMSDSLPMEAWEVYLTEYDSALDKGLAEKDAAKLAEEKLDSSGWVHTYYGWERYFQAPKMRELVNVPIFAAGRWTDSSGSVKDWSLTELDGIVSAFHSKVVDRVPLKLGHSSDAFNEKVAEALGVPVEVVTGEHGHGQMAIGWLSDIKRKGNSLIGSFSNIPEIIADMIEGKLYHAVSAEIDDEIGGVGPVITGVALLGVEEPAVDMAELDLAQVFGKPRSNTTRFIFNKEVTMNEKVKGFIQSIKDNLDNLAKVFQEKDDEIPDYIQAFAEKKFQGNIEDLKAWAKTVDWETCISGVTGEVTNPEAVCGWLRSHSKSGEHQEGETEMDLAQLVAALAKLLGMGDDATPESIVAKLEEMLKPPEGEGEGETPPASESKESEKEEVPEAVKTQFASMQSEIKNLKEANAKFEREKRVNKYNTIVQTLDALATPATLASDWADMEEKVGEDEVKKVVAHYQAANKAAKDAGILTVIGSSQSDSESTDPFAKEVQEYAKVNNIDEHKALVILSEQKPTEFNEYHERIIKSMES